MATKEMEKYAKMFAECMEFLADEGRPAAEVYRHSFERLPNHVKAEAAAWMPEIMGEGR